MKKLLIVIYIVAAFVSCGGATTQKENLSKKAVVDSEKPYLVFTGEQKKSFGKIKKSEQQFVDVTYEFENKGNNPLVIIKADVSCGCLSVDYTKEPVKKGEKGYVKVKVDTKSQEGEFNKSVFIKSNAANDVELLRIVGKIK